MQVMVISFASQISPKLPPAGGPHLPQGVGDAGDGVPHDRASGALWEWCEKMWEGCEKGVQIWKQDIGRKHVSTIDLKSEAGCV